MPVSNYHTWIESVCPSTSIKWEDLPVTITNSNFIIDLNDKPKKKSRKIPMIKQIYFNEKGGYTTIVWEDGSPSTVVHCGEGDDFERYLGFCAAVCKKLFGSTTAAKKLMDEKDADLAKKKKLEERLKTAEKRREEEAKNREKKEKREAARFEKLMKYVDKSMRSIDDLFAKEIKDE